MADAVPSLIDAGGQLTKKQLYSGCASGHNSKESKRRPRRSMSKGHYTSHATGNAVSKSMIIITDYTSLCKGDLIIVTGPSDSCCPICGGTLNVRSTCVRKVRKEGTAQRLRLRVMKCRICQKTHREIPDDVIPYKRTSLTDFCEIAAEGIDEYPCDTSTWQRMKAWLSWFLAFARSVERSLVYSGLLLATKAAGDSLRAETAYFVRLVVNSGNWIHNRSAMPVA